ncbi:diguanylate cyclase domain-containing protein [Desulfonatronovibrio magnus]|uniref:diguanylate cyclase domain-containing protein n=1 Tax=Desulfonatronovibrio magnus TaxID=698827 RepID=UPI0009FD07FA
MQAAAPQQHYGNSLSLILTGLDHFRKINDTRGHAGDGEVLRHFPKQSIRLTFVPGKGRRERQSGCV